MDPSVYKIIIFGVDDCPDCSDQKEIVDDYFGEGKYEFVNIDSESERDLFLMAKYSVDEVPTTIVIKKDGDRARVFKHAGVISANRLQKFLDKIK